MATQQQFLDFLSDIEPSKITKKRASDAHKALRNFLSNHETFKEYHINTFLSGSYKRDTAIRPQVNNGDEERPDVDIIVVTNHTLDDAPSDVLNCLYKTLEEKYDSIRKQTRSIGIETSMADMDVVLIISPNGMDGTLYIPDRKLKKWLETNPPRHTSWTTERNQDSSGRFKPLVKLVKWWRRENRTISKKPKGFIIECIVAECMNYHETHYEDLFTEVLEGIVDRYQYYIETEQVPHIDDPGVPGNNVLSNVTLAAFEGFYNKAKVHAELARSAQQEEDAHKELSIWREIFGERFPRSNLQDRASKLKEARISGSIFIDPMTGKVNKNQNSATHVKSPPHRDWHDKEIL